MNNRYLGEHITLLDHALSYIPKTERNRLDARKDFPFNKVWNGKFYGTKQVRPIFVVEHDTITVITVYTYYF